ncbi:hypothetical protein BDP27DRAFT_1448480 [Rhodocollybia butyracea]|uniref:Uncharacterized protein n=1 Tax=Rhodocollybia butyracea TaxID=206335 RepID=A0A9P5U6S0_9AGAR|nr:hypothetical protein BDP27DRAFT_1448480 [Rhodocollybia butyracea]
MSTTLISSLLPTRYWMHGPPHSEKDSRHYSSHGHMRRDDRELCEGSTHRAEGSFHPDSSFHVPVRHPHKDAHLRTIGPVEQNVHTIGSCIGHHTDEMWRRSSHGSDATPASESLSRRGPERNATQEPSTQQIRLLEAELLNAQRENRTKDDEIERLKRRLSSAHKDIGHYRRKDAHNQELLDTQRQELQGTRAFLNMFDSYSGGDIIEMLNTLNAEIFQAAAAITDMTERARRDGGSHRRSDDASVVEVRRTLGDEVGVLLQRIEIGGESVAIVQAALQTSLNIAVKRICRSWSKEGSVGKALNDVYVQIRAQQDQALVSGIWKSLTRAQSKRHVYKDHGVLAQVVEGLQVILVVAKLWPCGGSESEGRINSMILEKVTTILGLLARLDEAMNEHVTSTDMMLYVPALGIPFNAQIMEDEDGGESSSGGGESSSGTVLLVAEMGLMRVDKDSAGPDKRTVLLKPKVLLQESFVKPEATKAVRAEVQRRK